MPRSNRSAASSVSRPDIYRTITDQIIAQLEKGCVPWVQPWDSGHAAIGLPYNAASLRRYSGVNILTLWNAAASRGFSTQGFLTYRQAAALGGTVRRGERGTAIVYTRRVARRDDGGETVATEGSPAGSFSFLRAFTVFSTEQCEGLPADIVAKPAATASDKILPAARSLIDSTGADFRIGGPQAFYNPVQDFVAVPPPEAFHEPVNWHRTACHELAHWTGHRSRLNRDQSGAFGSVPYGQEELVAEMAGAFLCAALGITPTVRHADYIGSWLRILKQDKRAILRAATAASKACDYLLAFRDPAPQPGSLPIP